MKDMERQLIKRRLSGLWRRCWRTAWVLRAAMGFFVILIAGGLPSVLTGSAPNAGFLVCTAGALVGGAAVWLGLRVFYPARFDARPQRIAALRNSGDYRRHAKQGMLAFVSLYQSVKRTEFTAPDNWPDLAAEGRYDELKIADHRLTNMGPLLKGVEANNDRLEHLWLIATTDASIPGSPTDPNRVGSAAILPALVAYLHDHYPDVTPHCADGNNGDRYTVSLDHHEQIGKPVYDKVREVLLEAEELGIPSHDFVVDVTGGTVLMSLAAILANLDGDRDVQVIYAGYDGAHNVTGALVPVHVTFEPAPPHEA